MTNIFLLLLTIGSVLLNACAKEVLLPSDFDYECAHGNDSSAAHPKHQAYRNFSEQKTRLGLPGMIMLVKNPQYGVWVGATGKADLYRNYAMQPCNLSRIASISKVFCSVAILKLAEEGKLRLDDKASLYIPAEYTRSIENADKATIRQLLNHTSGIFAYNSDLQYGLDFLNNPTKNDWTPEKCLRYAAGRKAYFAQGEGFRYSNTNYVLLGMVLEAATKLTRYEVIQRIIIEPLRLTNTYFDPNNTTPRNTVRGYADLYGDGNLTETTDFAFGLQTLDGGMISNVFDLAVFLEALFVNHFLSASSLEQMMQWVNVPASDFDYAKGFVKYGLGLRYMATAFGAGYGHSGDHWGYKTYTLYFPNQRTTVALIINTSYGKSDQIIEQLIKELPAVILQ